METEKNTTIEEDLDALEKVIEKMESGKMTLEESLEEYEKGIALIRQSGAKIETAEKRLKILTEDGSIHDF